MVLVLIYGKQQIRIISAYAPQTGRDEAENLVKETELVGAKEFLVVTGDFNGHLGTCPEI